MALRYDAHYLFPDRDLMYKLSCLHGSEWIEHCYRPLYQVAPGNVTGGIPKGDAKVFDGLAACLTGPLYMLYVLHTPRGEAEPGRYQSPPLTLPEVLAFTSKYRQFLAGDARFDIWLHSPEDRATVVWDRHNAFFAYGPVDRFVKQLQQMGFGEGTDEPVGAHSHHYREGLDADARAVINEFEWTYSELRDEDQQ